MTIYVGNIPFSMAETDMEKVFAEFGKVGNVKIIKDKFSGKSRGYGFVEMDNDNEGDRAVAELNGKEIMGRSIKVNKAHAKKEY